MSPASEHPAALNETELLAQCRLRRGRRSGPGGQHRNKVETAVMIRHTPSGVLAEASERRSQADNRKVAIRRLRTNLALQIRRPRSAPLLPSPRWQDRCHAGRIRISPTHQEFPALLAEALDVWQCCNLEIKSAAAVLSVTPSQLVRFLKLEPRAWLAVNQARRDAGLHPLH